jgi:hypothetical protein
LHSELHNLENDFKHQFHVCERGQHQANVLEKMFEIEKELSISNQQYLHQNIARLDLKGVACKASRQRLFNDLGRTHN